MPGQPTPQELLNLFPHETSLSHGRSRGTHRHTVHAHGRSRSHATHHAGSRGGHGRGTLPRSVKIDVWKHKGQARGQG